MELPFLPAMFVLFGLGYNLGTQIALITEEVRDNPSILSLILRANAVIVTACVMAQIHPATEAVGLTWAAQIGLQLVSK